VAGVTDFFANNDVKEDIETPAFSLTKVSALIGVIVAGFGVAGAKIEDVAAVKVAAIGGAALVLVAYFGVAAVDLIVRQRAAEAKLRWPDGGGGEAAAPANGDSQQLLLPDREGLVLQKKHNGVEYEVVCALAEGSKVTLVARADGQSPLEPTFKPRA
jgi:hypothetical protein